MRNRLWSLLCLLAVFSAMAFGQGIVTGNISGTVEDPTGAAVTNATITATETQTNRVFTATTNEQGQYAVRQLPPGIYEVHVKAQGFEAFVAKGVVVNVGRETPVVAKMKIGGGQEVVNVEGSAPLVEATTVQIQKTFDSKATADLPVGNGFDVLALFVPGVASAGSAGMSNNNGAELAVNGQRGRSNNFQIDGQNNNDNSVGGPSIFFGNQDLIAEMQVITNYTAEYGRNMGSVVNYVTKSGTNSFHGTAYEYNQSNAFDSFANEEKNPLFGFCAQGQTPAVDGCTKPEVPKLVDNRFGGTVGGPIMKDKLWFFGSANFERIRTAGTPSSSGNNLVPTAAGLQQLAALFPNSPALAAYQQFGPMAVSAGNPSLGPAQMVTLQNNGVTTDVPFASITRMVPSLANDAEASGRIDWQVSNKDRFFGRYFFQQTLNTGVAGNSIAAGDFVSLPARDQQLGLDWTRNWTNTLLNQARISYSRAGIGWEGGAHPNCTRQTITDCPPSIGFSGGPFLGFGLYNAYPQGRWINVYQLQDNVSWMKGRHSIKIGGDWTQQRSPNVFLPNVNGSFTFGPTTDADGNVLVDAFTNFMLNQPSNTSLTLGNPRLGFKENDLSFYGQDDWRIKDNLTLNLGIRWEWFQQAINLLHDRTVAQQAGPNPFWSTSLPASLTTLAQLPQDLNNFGPVFGFAWTPKVFPGLFGNEKTVIRGGFRIAYDPQYYNMFLNTATNAPVVRAGSVAGIGTAPGLPTGNLTGADIQTALTPLIFATAANPGKARNVLVSPDFHNPYSQQWNFGVQRTITPKVAAEVRYVGNHTIGNFQNVNANVYVKRLIDQGWSSFIPNGVTMCSDNTQVGYGYVDCSHTIVQERTNTAFSIYHSLQSELRIQKWHGLAANIGYTWSKTIDNASEVYSTATGGSTVSYAQNPFNTNSAERAVSGIDFPQNFTVALMYDLPAYKGSNSFARTAFSGWQWNTTYRYLSGQPYTVVQGKWFSSNCDYKNTMSSGTDACRPILNNAAAPYTNVGVCTSATAAGCGLVEAGAYLGLGELVPMNLSDAHWVLNNSTSAKFFGSPFAGVARNTGRGDTSNPVNMSIFKNTKINERFSLRFEANAFNVFNTMFRGIPDSYADDVLGVVDTTTFGNNRMNASGGDSTNATQTGIGRRRFQFGLKAIF